MAPKRKKAKTSAAEPSNNQAADGKSSDAAPSLQRDESTAAQSAEPITPAHDSDAPSKPPSASSRWSWHPKASPTAEIARESISVAQGATTESSESTRPPNSVSKSVRGSRKSIPLAAEATKVHATGDASRTQSLIHEKSKAADSSGDGTGKEMVTEEAQLPPDPALTKPTDVSTRSSWFGWWSRPDGYASDSEKSKAKKQKLDDTVEETASNTHLPGTTPTDNVPSLGVKMAQDFEGIGSKVNQKENNVISAGAPAPQTASRSSWFGLWSNTQNQKAVTEESPTGAHAKAAPVVTVTPEPANVEEAMKNNDSAEPEDNSTTVDHPKPSAWAFWLSDKSKDAAPTPGGTQKQVGELAVADTPSQSNPEAAQFNEQREEQIPKPEASVSLLKPKRGRTDKIKADSAVSSSATSTDPSPAPSTVSTPPETPPLGAISQPAKKGKSTQRRPNLILPSFRDNFPSAPHPGYMERLTQYLAQTLHIPSSQDVSIPQHVFISPKPPKIKKAVAIGVHGFFPSPLVQKVLGQPTGTSIRFANYAATSIKSWCQEHQPEVKDVEVEKIALEGDGFVADRVTTLWKLLLNWLSHLRSAEFVFVACHSQGVPVAVMLVAKLIQLGCLSPTVRIGMCAMAGINLGPFLEYKSRLFGGSALELFEFSDYQSPVSKTYADSLDVCLRHGVRLTYVGSIDDQLVSLESSLHAPLSHPYVARAVFVDGRLHAPNFLTHLVVFALKLRNLGLGDHGLLRELSGPLAGSLVGGEGHSRIYDDPAVYSLAIEFALESSDVQPPSPPAAEGEWSGKAGTPRASSDEVPPNSTLASSIRKATFPASSASSTGVAPKIVPYEPPASGATANPFYLPWAVRGMLEEDLVRKDVKLREEVEMLVKEFEEWKPTSKVLKDVRWRLEGVRNMQ